MILSSDLALFFWLEDRQEMFLALGLGAQSLEKENKSKILTFKSTHSTSLCVLYFK